MSTSHAVFTLLPGFYEPSRYKDPTILLKRITDEFNIPINKFYYDKYSFENDVFIINNEYVFRFPRVKNLQEHFRYEIKLLDFLKNKITIPIPDYEFVSKDKDFGGYRLFPGKSVYFAVMKYISKKDKWIITKKLVDFVNVFHSITSKDFKQFNPLYTRTKFILIEEKVEETLVEKLFPKLSKEDITTINNFWTESKKYMEEVSYICPTHGDLYEWNTVWNKSTKEIGVIDFSCFMETDPARDFEVFCDLGKEYLNSAYEQYSGHKDKNFLKRVEIYWKLHGIYTLLSSQLGANITFDYAYKNYFKRKFNL